MLTDSELIRREQRKTVFRVVPPSDWRMLLRQRTNVLVTGPGPALDAFIRMARAELREPVVACNRGQLSPLTEDMATVIIPEVDALSVADQRRLCEWLERRPPEQFQVISLTSE